MIKASKLVFNPVAEKKLDKISDLKSSKWISPLNILILLGTITFVATTYCALNSEMRSSIRSLVISKQRVVLSTLKAKIAKNVLADIVKVKTSDGIWIEIYANENSGATPLIDRIKLRHTKDAHFPFQGRYTNLAVKDLDGDNVAEILVPTFDSNLSARLNVFQFNDFSNSIESAQYLLSQSENIEDVKSNKF